MAGQRKSRGCEVTYLDAQFVRNTEGRLVLANGILADEIETYTCLHCQKIVRKPPFMQPTDKGIGEWCYTCNGPFCGHTAECRNWHQNGNMTAHQFMETINENFARLRQKKWL